MALEHYFSEIGKYPLLTPEKELEVARARRAGDSTSRELLINSNLRLVVNIAKRYSKEGTLPDLIGEGNLALIDAAENYDPEWGVKFGTYAFKGIERRIWTYLDRQAVIQLPPEQKSLVRKIYRISNEYLIAHSEEPKIQHIVSELNKQQNKKKYTGNDVGELVQKYKNISVESLNDDDGEEGDFEKMDFIPGSDGRETEKDIAGKSLAENVRAHISQLNDDDRDRTILEMVLYEQKDYNEIATTLQLKKEHVRQRYTRGLRKLRANLKNSGIIES